ncbi:putative Dynein axonemal heavy chain 2 [Blattamonas nauphoetae]|uniref:Dynein axonemal heavy chain 2 n=1 Tax=Blattamonas nauphoetae TaxID=2049346 RepID=A0ABQ9Y452_9EUKA|nr:putative Dynein axonemal heavy chain 2 [Blattamonas nauphoetae]
MMMNQSASRNHLEYMLSKEERQKSNPPIPNTWPLFGGAASGIEFVTEEEKKETMKHVEMFNNTITLFIKTHFSRWLTEAIEGKDFEEYKKNCIFVRLFYEVNFWQKLPTVAQIPSSVVDFVEAEEAELLLAQQTVLLVVRDYNDILLSLPVQFADIFRIHLKHLDVMITKGVKTVKFNAPNVLTFCTKARQMCSDVMKLTRQVRTDTGIVEKQDEAEDDSDPTIKVYWDEYLKLIDLMILEALHLSVKRSLTDLMYALVGDKKAELYPLYVVEAILAGQKTEWNPTIKNLKKMVFDVREEGIMSAQTFPRVFTKNKKKIGNLTIKTDNDEEDNETKSVESAQNTSPDDPEHAGSQQLSFYDQIRNSTEIRDLSRTIQESFKPLVQNLRKFEQEYKAIMVAFQRDKDPQDAFNETYTEFPNLQVFENDINIWKERERQIVAKEPSQNSEFVRVDVVTLKDALIAHCKQQQEMYVNILNKAASGILIGICGDMDSTMVKMSKTPTTFDDLKALDVLLKESKEGLATIEAKFDRLQKQYELLERCSDILPVPDQETMLLLQLLSKFQASKQFITQQWVRMVDLKAAKKKELQVSLDQLASNITATRKRFLAQAPFQDRIAVDDANGIIGEFRDEVQTHRAEEKRLLFGIELFGLEQRVYGDLTATTKDLDDLSFLWGQKTEWQRLWDQWKTR